MSRPRPLPPTDPDRVLFTWPDRRFTYECRGCGACCKGLGIGLDVAGGQLAHLVERRPEVIPYLRRRGDAVTLFNPRDRCWFLDDGGLCRIESEDGRQHKPASCRLFPFNRVFRLGAWTVIDFNSVICPLRVTATGGITHDEVVAEVDSIADPAIVGTRLPAADAEADGRALVERERAVAAACFAAADRGDADAVEPAWVAQAGDRSLDTARSSVTDAVAALTGAAWELPTGATLAHALWLTPSMRFNELYGPRQYAARPLVTAALPGMWLAWLGFAAAGARAAGRDLGLQELTTIWSEQAPLAYLAARWTDAPSLKPGPIELPGVDPHRLVHRLAQACVDNRRARRPAADVLGPVLATAEPGERVAAVKSAEAVLRGAFAR